MNRLVDRFDALWHLFVKELMKFGVVGALAFLINASLTWILMHTVFEDGHLKAKFVATAVAIAFAWVANRLWTFRHKRQSDKRRELIQFLVANGIGMAIELGCLGFSYYVLGLTSAYASFVSGTIIGTILGTVFRYFAYRFWVFTEELDEDPNFADTAALEIALITGRRPEDAEHPLGEHGHRHREHEHPPAQDDPARPAPDAREGAGPAEGR
ncbi:GtrA family protein [Kocuria sp. CPCC 205268]|uniref:GtrA family protein n=1 Tax=Kocuria oxytropis TaxID=3058913 RepID=UPI0034D5789B